MKMINMMNIFLTLFISFVYAAEFSGTKIGAIERASVSRFDRLDSDTFYRIMTFLSAEEVLNLKILNLGTYRKVRKLWPKMNLSTTVYVNRPGRPVDFSHILSIYNSVLEVQSNQGFFYNQAQLSCLREFSLVCPKVRNFQAVIDLLPRDSLTTLRLINFGFARPLVGKIDFPKLTHLELIRNISLNHATFGSLPNCIEVLELKSLVIDEATFSSLVTVLGTMDKLEILSLSGCALPKDGLSAILENLSTSLKRLDITPIFFPDSGNKLSEFGLKRLKEMESLQEINFVGIDNEVASEIILSLPKCTTNIYCDMNRETLNAFQIRLGEFTNVKRINVYSVASLELYPIIQEIFPSLDEDTKERLGNSLINKYF